jgi:hypothetical protein
MKGMVFTELSDMVSKTFGEEMMDDILDQCDFKSGGAYTSVGTYDYRELLKIVSVLSKYTNIAESDLMYKYGQYLFGRFYEMMPQFFDKPGSSFEFLESVHDYIHVEVHKLYPDTELPSVIAKKVSEDKMIVTYTSQKPFSDFAAGLIRGCIDFYQQDIEVKSEDHNTSVRFCRVFELKLND